MLSVIVDGPRYGGHTRSGIDPRSGKDARSGVRPDLDVLVATAVEGFGLPAAALRDGIMQVSRVRTRRAGRA
ncbi:hypothetical protein [Actinomadura rudentiformis]|uniref:Uncharacterized protein n=1 Tax=Actinomadura rudentiformis TaxID=359158 RepID=A0A6H9YRM9_9ACTN|nr:hypothetical protein [Actinomadura rudentiformis]KAB2342083.1 hypothetical protein F8566_39065 [Actinomadura rudentiformis]